MMQKAAAVEWTDWIPLDEAAPLLAIGTAQTYDELADTMTHLAGLGLMRFSRDEAGAIFYSVRTDPEARATALLDDQAQLRRN